MWAQGQAIGLSALLGVGWTGGFGATEMRNPLVGNYRTSDDRWVAFICLQGGSYWPDFCRVVGRPDLSTDERFATHEALMQNGE
jgi:crotonobetainyl-CoA:carnitine CoA-transferase CaiB-like acyl-CoA transferase